VSADPERRPLYESEDAQPRVVVATGAALAGIIALGLIAGLLFDSRRPAGHADQSPFGPEGMFQHGAAERTSIGESWADSDRAVRSHLEGYAWVDRRAGIVRIPIERAIDLVCAETAPAAKAQGLKDTSP
jgi:hypothetical protein